MGFGVLLGVESEVQAVHSADDAGDEERRRPHEFAPRNGVAGCAEHHATDARQDHRCQSVAPASVVSCTIGGRFRRQLVGVG